MFAGGHAIMRRSRHLFAAITLLTAAACAPGAAPATDPARDRAAVDSVLSTLHQSASAGDFEAYFELFSPDAVFFGTDATERWSVDELRGYASASQGWTYTTTERNIFVDADGNTAWFDERLRNAKYGETRGTGVLVKSGTGWRIAQYNLSFPIPNDLAEEFTRRIVERENGQ